MAQGVVFELREFCVHDGPGVRQTVFFKGCPMRCVWCHNPEGWEQRPQLLVRRNTCVGCGVCETFCKKAVCDACGQCIQLCPSRARQICGETLTASELARRIRVNAREYESMGGGVTFSGGEPLAQAEFLFETVVELEDMHKVLETCGYATAEVFQRAMESFDLIYMDMKLMDPAAHRAYTGVDNGPILANAARLRAGKTPFVVRVPLIPGVTDTEENLTAVAAFLQGAPALQLVELLPYNTLAGAKYTWLGLTYVPPFDDARKPAFRHDIFKRYGLQSI